MGIAMRYVYPARLARDASGRILAKFPDVPEALTDGADREEALAEAQDALLAALSGYVRARRSIPVLSAPRRGQPSGLSPAARRCQARSVPSHAVTIQQKTLDKVFAWFLKNCGAHRHVYYRCV